MKKILIFCILSCHIGCSFKTNLFCNEDTTKCLFEINDSIKGYVMNSKFFIDDIKRICAINDIDSSWNPTNADIHIFEKYINCNIDSISATIKRITLNSNYLRQYYGYYFGGKKVLVVLFQYFEAIQLEDPRFEVYKKYPLRLLGGGIMYFFIIYDYSNHFIKIEINHPW